MPLELLRIFHKGPFLFVPPLRGTFQPPSLPCVRGSVSAADGEVVSIHNPPFCNRPFCAKTNVSIFFTKILLFSTKNVIIHMIHIFKEYMSRNNAAKCACVAYTSGGIKILDRTDDKGYKQVRQYRDAGRLPTQYSSRPMQRPPISQQRPRRPQQRSLQPGVRSFAGAGPRIWYKKTDS